jgi:LPS export ABC transporter protein LptC
MLVLTRNLLLFLALSGTAIVTWVLARDSEPAPAGQSRQQQPPRGFYSVDAQMQSIDDDGRIVSSVFARRIDQQPESDGFELDGISVEYRPESGSRLDLTADRAFMSPDRSMFDLHNVQAAFQPPEGGERLTIDTSALRLDAERSLASTSESLIFRLGNSELSAVGLMLELETGKFRLEEDVESRAQR